MHKTYEFEDSHYLRSGKRYKVDHRDYFLEYYPSISEGAESNPEESGLKPTTPQRTIGSQGTPLVAVVVIPLLVVRKPLRVNRLSYLVGTRW